MLLLLVIGPIYATDCSLHLNNLTDSTDQLITYLKELQNEGIINETGLIALANSIDLDNFINPIDLMSSYTDPSLLVHYERLAFLLRGPLDTNKLYAWIIQNIKEQRNIIKIKTTTIKKSKDTYIKLSFNKLNLGRFDIQKLEQSANNPNKIEIAKASAILTEPTEFSSTPITVGQWYKVMKDYPIKNLEISNDIENRLNEMAKVSFLSAMAFANKLSKKEGLANVYPLDNTNTSGSANQGTLLPRNSIEWLNDLVLQKNYYEQEGYRLPTTTELLYLINMATTKDNLLWTSEWFKRYLFLILQLPSIYYEARLDLYTLLTKRNTRSNDRQKIVELVGVLNNVISNLKEYPNYNSLRKEIIYNKEITTSKYLFVENNKFYAPLKTFAEWGFDGSYSEDITDLPTTKNIIFNFTQNANICQTSRGMGRTHVTCNLISYPCSELVANFYRYFDFNKIKFDSDILIRSRPLDFQSNQWSDIKYFNIWPSVTSMRFFRSFRIVRTVK